MPIICQPTLRIIGLNTTKGREDNQNLIGKPDNQKIKMFIKCQILVNATKIKQNKLIVCTVVMTGGKRLLCAKALKMGNKTYMYSP